MLSTDPDVRKAYSADVSGLVMLPDAVARPSTAEEVQEIMRQAAADRTAVTAAGGQTSTTGASISDTGVLLSLRGMDRIIDVDRESRRAIVQPGVLLGALNRAIADTGLHFAPDPTSEDDVTIGGAVACNASGARTLLYGATRAHVRSLDVVLANGERARVGRSGLDKNTAGYAFAQDPVDWFIGSEGTLGIIVEAELALTPLPPHVIGLGIPCVDETSALQLVVAIRESADLRPRCIEYFDGLAMQIARERSGRDWGTGAGALVYVEDTASAAGDVPLDAWLEIAEDHNAVGNLLVFDGEAALRDARKMRHAVPATMNERGSARRTHGGRKVSTDWAVPYRKLAQAIAEARALVEDANVPQPVIYGHAGNGHPHENFIAQDADELHRIETAVEATLRHVISVGGTVSAEHGIGKIKRRWLPLQATPMQIGVMRSVKRELDPLGLLAPGNIL
jgi:FAD/FMN-containing dehydrogenase